MYRFFSTRARAMGVWSDFSRRPSTLKVADEHVRSAIFNGIPPAGPPSIQTKAHRERYHLPELLDDTFKAAYELLEQDAAAKYERLAEQRQQMTPAQIRQAEAAAEAYNPEVAYNVARGQWGTHPVYLEQQRQQWQLYDLMVTMQRLEQHHVIPDTLPTVEPRAHVQVGFGHNADATAEFARWLVPGEIVPAAATARPPTVHVMDFDRPEGLLYTVLLVNPDVPDETRNTYQTRLHYGLCNVRLSAKSPAVGPAQLMANPETVFQHFVPLTPGKNTPPQRACLWVLRQEAEIAPAAVKGAFDIRRFVEQHSLDAVGAHMWRQAYDRSVPAVRAEYGLGAAPVYDPVRNSVPYGKRQ